MPAQPGMNKIQPGVEAYGGFWKTEALPGKRGILAQFEDCAAQLRAGRLASDGALMAISAKAPCLMRSPARPVLSSMRLRWSWCTRLRGWQQRPGCSSFRNGKSLSRARRAQSSEGCQRLFRRLLSARCEGSAWFAGAEAALRGVSSAFTVPDCRRSLHDSLAARRIRSRQLPGCGRMRLTSHLPSARVSGKALDTRVG